MTRHDTVPLGTVVPASALDRIESKLQEYVQMKERAILAVADALRESGEVPGYELESIKQLHGAIEYFSWCAEAIRQERGT